MGYLIELKTKDQNDYRWVWVSMDKFTDDLAKIAVPTVENDGLFQKLVSNLHVEAGSVSGVAPVKTGDWADGNIEFTPFNYDSARKFNFDGSVSGVYDYDDTLSRQGGAGYGCMQVHNYREKETVFAFNNFNLTNNGAPDVTIGNAPGADTDGTFLHNAGSFEIANMRVFVRPTSTAHSRGTGPAFSLQPRGAKFQSDRSKTVTLTSLAPDANYYQWFKDGKVLVGETGCDITVPAVRASAGVYQVVAYYDNDNYTVSDPAELKRRNGFAIKIR